MIPIDIHGGDTNRASFSTGDVTLTPFIGNTPATFNFADVGRLGIDDQVGSNPNSFNDLDTIPNNGNEERLELAFAPGSGLSQLGWDFARADGPAPSGVNITGFVADPQAFFSDNSTSLTALYDSGSGSLRFELPGSQFGAALRTINFANVNASLGQTLSISVVDIDEPGAQLPIRVIRYEAASSVYAGDVTGNTTVDLDDYNVIRTNMLGTFPLATSRESGDLNRDGIVGIADFVLWKEAYQALNPGAAIPASVPEPSSAALLALGAMILAMRRRLQVAGSLAVFVALLGVDNPSNAQTTILPSDIPGGVTSSTTADGFVTLSGFVNGVPAAFNDNPQFFGVAGGLNTNAFDDQDGNPLTTTDQEELRLSFAANVGLSGMTFNFTQVVPMQISGFQSDPFASFASNPGGAASTVYDASTGSLYLYHPQFTSDQTELAFANTSASAGQTLSLVVWNYNGPLPQQTPQIAINAIEYSAASLIGPGDVNGDGAVDSVDFGLIRDNFRASNATRLQGDLTGDGFVDFDDFVQWQDNFSGSASLFAAQLTAVPEPGAVVTILLASASGFLLTRARRR